MRARNLKPAFFKNDELAELPMAARLMFQGLWCMADREGRLEDRPARIKAETLPYDEVNADELLQILHDRGFILRYTAGMARLILVVNFKKHQSPHKNEAESVLPAPDDSTSSTMQAPESHPSTPPDSLNLTADSLTDDCGLRTPELTRAPTAAPVVIVTDTPYLVFTEFLDEIGTAESDVSPAWKAKQLAIAKRLLEQGYAARTVRGCAHYMRLQDWRTDPFDLGGVEKFIGTWEADGKPVRPKARAPNGRHKRNEPDYGGIEEFSRRMDAIDALEAKREP